MNTHNGARVWCILSYHSRTRGWTAIKRLSVDAVQRGPPVAEGRAGGAGEREGCDCGARHLAIKAYIHLQLRSSVLVLSARLHLGGGRTQVRGGGPGQREQQTAVWCDGWRLLSREKPKNSGGERGGGGGKAVGFALGPYHGRLQLIHTVKRGPGCERHKKGRARARGSS